MNGVNRVDGARRRFLSVCSGIEAASVAWGPLGWRAAGLSEIEPFPRAVLAHHYPDVPLFGDFTAITPGDLDAIGPVSVLCGGTPCQSFSVAGLRRGLDDPRGNLALAFLRLADLARPRWVVWENVPGVLSSNGGRDFGAFLGALGQLGYGWAYRVLDAQYFGVPQRRRRVFVVGCLGDWRAAAAVLFERAGLSGHPAPRREAGKAAPTIPSRSTAGGGLGTDFDCDGGLVAATRVEAYQANGLASFREGLGPLSASDDNGTNQVVAHTLTGGGRETQPHGALDGVNLIAHTLRASGFDASEDGTGRGTPLVPVLAPTIVSNGDAHSGFRDERGLVAIAIQERADSEGPGGPGGKGWNEEVAFTMEARHRPQRVAHGMAVRRLTPRECERLQGFPDDYTAIPWRGKPASECPDGPRYKALGNSWAVPCAQWIGERIDAVDAIAALEVAA